jgi:hypothetical protein
MATLTKKQAKAIAEIRDSYKRHGLHGMTFAPIPQECKKEMEAFMQQHIRIWWESWIEPRLQDIESR